MSLDTFVLPADTASQVVHEKFFINRGMKNAVLFLLTFGDASSILGKFAMTSSIENRLKIIG